MQFRSVVLFACHIYYDVANFVCHQKCWSEENIIYQVTIIIMCIYYIPIIDTTFELFVFWPSDTESGNIKFQVLSFGHFVALKYISHIHIKPTMM